MRVLAVHPGPLMYTKIFLRLEPLGLELAAAAARKAGHAVRLVALQADSPDHLARVRKSWRPDVLLVSMNYLANLPEVVDIAKATKAVLPGCAVLVGGHSASFVAGDLLDHGAGAIDAVLTGEGESVLPPVLAALAAGDGGLHRLPGVVTPEGRGPRPSLVDDLDALRPARDLLRHRRRYFIGALDPCASIEFSRGCPWDCSFCSAWTFYGRSYRLRDPEAVADELATIREPGVFIVDDVAFVQARHGDAIAAALERSGIRKRYYMETRGDVLLRNFPVFERWARLGLTYMFIGIEAIDAEGLKRFRKRTDLDRNRQALEAARSLGIQVAINIIADPNWDEARFATVRAWCLEVPEIVNISVNTPYPGTESWLTDGHRTVTRDYRLYDIQHAVLPTRLPLERFYAELVKTQSVLNAKHLGWTALKRYAPVAAGCLLRGQTNFLNMLWRFGRVYDPAKLLADHAAPVRYAMAPPPALASSGAATAGRGLYIHAPATRTAVSSAG